jgi:hypothetical protein
MPTRRVALETAYLPTSGPAHGSALLAAVVATHLVGVDDEQRDLLPRLVDQARDGLTIPRIALRHRLQNDKHGLDRSRHRVVGENGSLVVEVDVHGAATPQVLGAIMGAASLPPSGRGLALDTIARVVDGRWPGLSSDVIVRAVWDRAGIAPPPLAGTRDWDRGAPPEERQWDGISVERRWAMEVFGMRAGMDVDREEISRRFRRLLRDAHPDHGGAAAKAATRIAELTEARTILLDAASADVAAEG